MRAVITSLLNDYHHSITDPLMAYNIGRLTRPGLPRVTQGNGRFLSKRLKVIAFQYLPFSPHFNK